MEYKIICAAGSGGSEGTRSITYIDKMGNSKTIHFTDQDIIKMFEALPHGGPEAPLVSCGGNGRVVNESLNPILLYGK